MTPDSLLVHPCDSVEAGDTVGSLASGYVTNTSCLTKYQLLIDKIKKNKKEKEELYGR